MTGFIWAFAYIFTPSFSADFSLIVQILFKMKAFSKSFELMRLKFELLLKFWFYFINCQYTKFINADGLSLIQTKLNNFLIHNL